MLPPRPLGLAKYIFVAEETDEGPKRLTVTHIRQIGKLLLHRVNCEGHPPRVRDSNLPALILNLRPVRLNIFGQAMDGCRNSCGGFAE